MRLPNIYYTNQYFYGVTEPMGKPAPIEKYVGESLQFDIYLNHNEQPVLANDWDIIANVKSTTATPDPSWVGTIGNGIYENNKTGYYKIVIPSEKTKDWLAGTYWLEILIKEKIAKFNNIADNYTVLLRLPVTMDYSNHSSYKDLTDQSLSGSTPHLVDIKHI